MGIRTYVRTRINHVYMYAWKMARSIRDYFSTPAPPHYSSDSCSEVEEDQGTSTQEGGECSIDLEHRAKRPRSHARQSGFNKDWSRSYSWVMEVEGEGRLCRKHNRRPQKAVVGKTTWVDIPCVTVTQTSLRRHDTSRSHLQAKRLEAQLCLSTRDGRLQQSFAVVESAERKAMKAAMKCLYWLAKQEIPHTTNFVGLLDLVKSLGAIYINDLKLMRIIHQSAFYKRH